MNGVGQIVLKLKPVTLGTNVRMSFSKINEVLDVPNLIEVQKNSYRWFLREGLKQVFKDVSTITDYQGNLALEFIDYRLDDKPKYTIEECKERDRHLRCPVNCALPAYSTGRPAGQGA
jgi:DNA-directed RNA polymerase subunit beta